ncbi:MAG: hypothetical protein K0Q51_15 [Rickettsiaceae bacterium]|jgi:anthranilate/para-aminobenzoate synthase component II/ankyrin repeat protein|nr:hypothetical protein [Rickettsiaceae bacterium]
MLIDLRQIIKENNLNESDEQNLSNFFFFHCNVASGIQNGSIIDLKFREGEAEPTSYEELIKKANSVSSLYPFKFYEFLLSKGLKAQEFLESIIIGHSPQKAKEDRILELALKYGASYATIDFSSLSLESIAKYKEIIINSNNAQSFLAHLFNKSRPKYNSQATGPNKLVENYEKLDEVEIDFRVNLIEYAKNLGGNVELALKEAINKTFPIVLNDGSLFPLNVSNDVVEKLAVKKLITGDNLLQFAVIYNLPKMAEKAIKEFNANTNLKFSDEDNDEEVTNYVQLAVSRGKLEVLKVLIDNGVENKLEPLTYLKFLNYKPFQAGIKLLSMVSCDAKDKELYDILRAEGASEVESKDSIDTINLIKDYAATKAGTSDALSEVEIRVLEGNITINELEKLDLPFKNKYGYNALHLAIIANQYNLAKDLIVNNSDIYAKNINGATPIYLIIKNYYNLPAYKDLLEALNEKLDNVDLEVSSGETIADALINDPNLFNKVLQKTNDSLFYFLKENADPKLLQEEENITNIAISHGEGFWSQGIWSAARLMAKNHKNIKFYLITKNMVDKFGEDFLKKFDAFINPGAGDSYPKHLSEFTIDDYKVQTDLEQFYQFILKKSEELKALYLGICAGSQHFALYHEGFVGPVKGYTKGRHTIDFITGSIPYLLALTKEQKEKAFKEKVLPKISVHGDTAHHYAAIKDKLGKDIELGAVSEEGVPMSYAHKCGIRISTQFHPEHRYGLNSDDPSDKQQIALLENFLSLSEHNHEYRLHHINISPEEKILGELKILHDIIGAQNNFEC